MNAYSRAAALLAALLAGCTNNPFQATWYLVDYDTDPKGLFVALVNRSATTQTIHSLVLNPQYDSSASGWQWTGPIDLESGEVLVINQEDLRDKEQRAWTKCRIPIELIVTTSHGPLPPLRPIGNVPSALPVEWFKCPN